MRAKYPVDKNSMREGEGSSEFAAKTINEWGDYYFTKLRLYKYDG